MSSATLSPDRPDSHLRRPARRIAVFPTRPVSRIGRWTLGAVALALVLRIPFLWLPLRLDEGGLALVGRAFVDHHFHAAGSLYGGMWIDRPPLLMLVYGGAEWLGGAIGIRLLGAVGAVAIIVIANRIAVALGYARAVPFVSVTTALLTSSPLISGTYAYPELLAAAVSAGVMLMVCLEHGRAKARAERWFVAGLLAACALLLKQSFLDGLAVGCVGSIVIGHRLGWRRTVAPFVAGVAAMIAATAVWAITIGPGIRPLLWAMFGFRIAGVEALRRSPVPMSVRLHHLEIGAVAAAYPVLVPCAVAGIAVLAARRHRGRALLCATWLGAGCVGVAGGGYYWGHYMLQLIPASAVVAGIAIMHIPRRSGRFAVAALVGFNIVGMVGPALGHTEHLHQRHVTGVADVVASNRRAGDRLLVVYSRANVAYYSHVKPAFPYEWSLMYAAIPGVEQRMRTLLRSEGRPAWVIQWQRSTREFGLDESGETARLIASRYRRVARVCGRDVFLRNDDGRSMFVPPKVHAADCGR